MNAKKNARPVEKCVEMKWNCTHEELERAIENPEAVVQLDVSGHAFCKESVEILSKLTSLRVLIMKNCCGVDDVLKTLSCLNLHKLSLYFSDVTEVGMECVGNMVNLKGLDLSKCYFGETVWLKVFGYLSGLSLCELFVRNTYFGDDAFEMICGMVKLRRLDMGFCSNVSKRALGVGIRRLVNLEWLNIVACNMSSRILGVIVGLRELRGLDMSLCRLGGSEGFRILEKCEKLEELRLERTAVDDDVLCVLGRLKNLKKLDVSECNVTSRGLGFLSGVDDVCCNEMFLFEEGLRRKVVRNKNGVWDFCVL